MSHVIHKQAEKLVSTGIGQPLNFRPPIPHAPKTMRLWRPWALNSLSSANSAPLYPNNLKNRFLAAMALPHNFRSHSRLTSRQWSLAPIENSEEPPCQIPDSSSCLGIKLAKIEGASLPYSQFFSSFVYIALFLVSSLNLFSQAQGQSICEDFFDYTNPPTQIVEEEVQDENARYRDLEELCQDYVLETKRIFVPGYPDAFNPSIIRWKNRLLMSFRTYHPETRSTHEIALVELNADFEPLAEPKFLKFISPDPHCSIKRQDPRLVEAGGELYIVYNNSYLGEVRRMVFGRIEFLDDGPIVHPSDSCMQFDGEKKSRSEKNWVPFDFEGRLHLAYSIVPHRIFLPEYGTSSCATIASTLSSFKWDWGVLRGGTPALLEGDEYLAFFHCSKSMATSHSQGKSIPHYFMGAYMFSSKPPFHLTRICPEPLFGKNFYKGRAYKTWKPCRVVFPGGFITDNQFIWIFYGRQDHEIWVVKIDKKAMLDRLLPLQVPCDS